MQTTSITPEPTAVKDPPQPAETTVDTQIYIEESPPAVQQPNFSNLPGSRPGSKLSRIEEDPEVSSEIEDP